MPTTGLLALLDDITAVLDDVSTMTQVAARKTAGVVGDDLALNAQQVSGFRADRELPVVWAVVKGSAVNKAILVPGALLISALTPWLVTPLLMLGGVYLCFEGAEKLIHPSHQHRPGDAKSADVGTADWEKGRIGTAISTDFILSAEIIIIALGTVADHGFVTRLMVLTAVAALMTLGVYGAVAGIVKLDDVGQWLVRRNGRGQASAAARALGRAVLKGAPWLMRGLAIVGMVAMFLVGGGILSHGIPGAEHAIETFIKDPLADVRLLATLAALGADALIGVCAGFLALGLYRAAAAFAGSR